MELCVDSMRLSTARPVPSSARLNTLWAAWWVVFLGCLLW
jgi:hypothetical protein